MKGKLLIVDDLHPAFKKGAEELGYEVSDLPDITVAEALEQIANYEVLAIRTKFAIDKDFLERAEKLKIIARAGAGLDNIDVDLARSRNINLINAPEGNRDAVAEHCMGMLLALMNKFNQAQSLLKKGIWDRESNRGIELKGKTVALIGYGYMGKALARKLKGFEVNIIAFDKYKTGYSDEFVKEVSMDEVVRQADVLSLHIPLSRETRMMVDQEYLRHFRKSIFLLNTARGEIVDTSAVLTGIRTGSILGAGLDVLEIEKFPALAEQDWYSELAQHPQVILTPHVAGWTHESYQKISEVLLEKLSRAGI